MTEQGVRIIPTGRGHRPRGSGATTVRLVQPAGGSGRLYIGRRLWQDIGEPARVALERFGTRITIQPGDDFSISGKVGNSIPRLSLGKPTMEQLGLDPGTYTAHVIQGKNTIVVDGLVAESA